MVQFADLLARAGIDAESTLITPWATGGNNRIYRVETTAGVFAAKQYFRHEGDSRDRLAAEYAFLKYASAATPGMTPRPYASNPDSGMALYEFIEGRRFSPGQVGRAEIDAAARFFRSLNSRRASTGAELPVASEACFSLADHLALIEGRIQRLLQQGSLSGADSKTLDFLQRLDDKWRQVAAEIRRAASSAGFDLDCRLATDRQCITPSDFGFHNALREEGGNIRFLDFEYAGWDDPAKAAADFFAQIEVPVPAEFFDYFVREIMRVFPDSESLVVRARLLRPAYRIKWCCIALNIFLPVHLARRTFANPDLDTSALKEAQLAKATQILNSMDKTVYGLC